MDLEDQIKLKEDELKKLKLKRAFEVLHNTTPEDIQAAIARLKKQGKISSDQSK